VFVAKEENHVVKQEPISGAARRERNVEQNMENVMLMKNVKIKKLNAK